MTRVEKVREALYTIYEIYGFQGESGTEELFHLLDNAMVNVSIELQESHEDGLCLDCVSALAHELEDEVVLANGITA